MLVNESNFYNKKNSDYYYLGIEWKNIWIIWRLERFLPKLWLKVKSFPLSIRW
jgi:hypothetical protein